MDLDLKVNQCFQTENSNLICNKDTNLISVPGTGSSSNQLFHKVCKKKLFRPFVSSRKPLHVQGRELSHIRATTLFEITGMK